MGSIGVRDAVAADRDFVMLTARRLAAFGPPPWRSPLEIVGGEVRTLDEFFDGLVPRSSLLIAEDAGGERLGFAYLEAAVDYFTETEHAHLGMIALTESAEGRGAGRALMEAAEAWARSRGHSKLTLNVFDGNRRAREFYERLGYRVETLRYVKPFQER